MLQETIVCFPKQIIKGDHSQGNFKVKMEFTSPSFLNTHASIEYLYLPEENSLTFPECLCSWQWVYSGHQNTVPSAYIIDK